MLVFKIIFQEKQLAQSFGGYLPHYIEPFNSLSIMKFRCFYCKLVLDYKEKNYCFSSSRISKGIERGAISYFICNPKSSRDFFIFKNFKDRVWIIIIFLLTYTILVGLLLVPFKLFQHASLVSSISYF